MIKPKIIILGKLPPPLMGPAIATSIILNSELNKDFELLHLKTNINSEVSSMGRFSFGKAFKNLGLYFKLFGKCISKRPKLVLIPISQTTMGFLKDAPYIWLSWITGRKVLLQLRGSNWLNWLESSSGLTRWYVKLTCKRATGVIVLGNNLKYLFSDIFDEDQIFVVPNGGNYNFPVAEKNLKTEILYLANYLPTKGFDIFLESLEGIDKEKYIVNAYGSWDNVNFKAKCEGIIGKLDLPVNLHGAVSGDEKFQALSNADMFVFIPQHREGHPWVTIEAMAAGLPIIATDQGAIIESVLNGRNGFIVGNQNIAETKKAIETLIEDKTLRSKFGEESKSIYASGFTEDHMIDNLRATFKKVIS